MASSVKIVGTCISESGIGSRAWTNPSNATADDTSYAETPNVKDTTMNRLKGTMSGNLFSIPSGATIDGIIVEAYVYCGSTGSWEDNEIRLVVGGTAGTGDDNGRGAGVTWDPAGETLTWGTSTDLWGLTLDDTDINSSGFGASISCVEAWGIRNIAYVDYIKISVFYTESAGPKEADGAATATGTTGNSFTKTTAATGTGTATGTTGHSLTKTTAVGGSATATGTTGESTPKTTAVSGSGAATGTTGHGAEAVKTVSVATSTATGPTGHSFTKTTAVAGSAAATGTTGDSFTKTTAVSGSATATGTTGSSTPKTTDVAGSAAATGTTGHAAETVKTVSGTAAATGTTGHTTSKAASVDGSATVTGATGYTVTKTTSTLGTALASAATAYTLTKTTAVGGSAAATGTASGTASSDSSPTGAGLIGASFDAEITSTLTAEGWAIGAAVNTQIYSVGASDSDTNDGMDEDTPITKDIDTIGME